MPTSAVPGLTEQNSLSAIHHRQDSGRGGEFNTSVVKRAGGGR